MEPMTIREIMEAVGGSLLGEFGDLNRAVSRVETDSRTIHAGSLFVPLVFPLLEPAAGHTFLLSAATILGKVFPTLVCPFLAAQLLRRFVPVAGTVQNQAAEKVQIQFDIPGIGVAHAGEGADFREQFLRLC